MAFNNLSEIIYEEVNKEYGWGKYGAFKVLIRRKDGYINATKLCKDGGKELKNWLRLDSSNALMNEAKRSSHMSCTFEQVTAGTYDLRGTYVHPKLIPHIASWVSPAFAIMVSDIVNEFIIQEYKAELRRKEKELSSAKDEIKELIEEVKEVKVQNSELLLKNNELLESNKLLHQKLDLANENIIETVRGINQANRNIRGVQSALGSTAENHVPTGHIQRKDAETYAIYFCEQKDGFNVYTQCRARPFHLRRRVKQLAERYGENFREVIIFKPVPNARTLASEFERRIESHGAILDLKYQTISLSIEEVTLTEQRMIELAREVFEERHEPAEESKEVFPTIAVEIDEKTGKITAEEEPEIKEPTEPEVPTYQEQFAQLMSQRMDDLKATARTFPRDLKTFGGWSGKNKTELVEWILLRRGVTQ